MNARLSPNQLLKSGSVPVLPQSGALCYRMKHGRPEVLLITTRRSGHWIVPKGWLIDGLSPAQTAVQEAWEEAGAVGQCGLGALGQYAYLKQRTNQGAALCLVDVFPLYVQSLGINFPEQGERKRKWFSPKKAAQKVRSPELAEILRGFRPYTN